MKKILALALVLAFSLSFSGCSDSGKSVISSKGISSSAESSAVTTEQAETSATTPVTASASEPTQNPTPTPNPDPQSVYIPRDPLPGGRLIEEGLFAVIPGEGAYYNVFDCYGKQVDSFLFKDAESMPPIGIFTELELSKYRRVNQKDVQTLLPEDPGQYNNLLKSTANGFYQISRANGNNSKVILYNIAGEPVRTLTYKDSDNSSVDIALICFGDETVVSFQSYVWQEKTNTPIYSITIYFVAQDGAINNKCVANDLPGKPVELLGRKYFIAGSSETEATGYSMFDFEGNVIINGVLLLDDKYENPNRLITTEASTHIYISDYYIKDGLIYDSSLNPVEKNEIGSDGRLIYGNEYDFQGITCKADQYKQGVAFNRNYDYSQLIAVGTSGDKMAIKTQDAEYVIDRNGAAFYCMNSHVVVLGPAEGHNNQVVSLDTGEVLCSIENASGINIADEYIVVYTGVYDPNNGTSSGAYIIDNSGNIRYMTEGSAIGVTHGAYIILHRGPYVGISDLNGDWIVKSLSWNLSRDEVYVDPWA
ncbi:MAG: hypothetical protein WCG21_09130 [Eubacteriales bacterium]